MKNILLIFGLLLTGCASYTPGDNARQIKSDSQELVSITSNVDSEMSFKDLVFVNFYFANKSANWARVKNIEILDIENHPDARIIVSGDLHAWGKAMEHKIAIDSYNRKILTGAIALAGAGVMIKGANSNSKGTTTTGLVITSGALVINDVQNLMKNVSDLERSSLVPEDHLYSPFTIPPHLVTNKWILFQTTNPNKLCTIDFKVTFIDGTSTVFNGSLNDFKKGCKNEL